MTLTLTIGGTPQPLPREEDGYESEYLGFGTQFRTFDATLKTQRLGNKWRVRLYWEGLSLSEKSSLMTTFSGLLTAASTIVFPDGAALLMQGVLGSWSERVWYSPWTQAGYYNVSFQVEQV